MLNEFLIIFFNSSIQTKQFYFKLRQTLSISSVN